MFGAGNDGLQKWPSKEGGKVVAELGIVLGELVVLEGEERVLEGLVGLVLRTLFLQLGSEL